MQVCFVQGKPTIAVRTCNTKTNWLYDTGAAVTVISKKLYDRFSPKPSLSPNPYHITGANQKPLKIKGLINLPIRVLDKKSDIQALVCPQLSGDAILGMDTIRQLGIALNPVTQEYFEVNSIQDLQGTIAQTIRLEPLSVAVIKIKIPCDDGQTTDQKLRHGRQNTTCRHSHHRPRNNRRPRLRHRPAQMGWCPVW